LGLPSAFILRYTIRAVRVVVHGEHFHAWPRIDHLLCPVHDEVEGLPRLLPGEVLFHELFRPAGVHEVVEADPWYAFVFHEIEDAGDLVHVALVHGEAKPHLDPLVHGIVDALQGVPECAFHPAELVVDRFHAVEAHPDVGEPEVGKTHGHVLRDERAVRRDDRAPPGLHRVLYEHGEVFSQCGLAAGEEDDRRTVLRELLDEVEALLRRQLPRGLTFRCIAVHAAQVAGARGIPDHDGLLVACELEEVGRELARRPPVP